MIFVGDQENKKFPTIPISVKSGRHYLSHKTVAAFDYIYQNYLDDADWFMKADDDTYVVMENLRYLLSSHNPDEPIFFGHLFKLFVQGGYPSGGAGYVVSKEVLRRYGAKAKTIGNCQPREGAAEDLLIGKCFGALGAKAMDGRDKFNRTRFHCLSSYDFIRGNIPYWLPSYNKFDIKTVSNLSLP